MKNTEHSNNRRRSERGFTLVELMVAGVVGVIVVGGAAGILLSQGRFHDKQVQFMQSNRSLRQAISYMRPKIAMAGYGIPRTLLTSSYSVSNYATNSDGQSFGDRLHIGYRNVLGEWQASRTSATNLSLTMPTADDLDPDWPKGQALFVFNNPGSFGTVVSTNARVDGSNNILVKADNHWGFALPPQDNDHLKVALLESYVFYVRAGVNSQGENSNILVVEPGIDLNNDGKVDGDDYMPLAEDIQEFKVKYFSDSNHDGFLSADELTGLTAEGVPTTDEFAVADIKAIEITITGYQINKNTGDKELTSISEYISLNNMMTQKGVVASEADVTNFVWMGSEIFRTQL
jgi:type II secretory pathway pseudopilin PulG